MSFSFSEIINSVFCAIIYGVVYFIFFIFSRFLYSRISHLKHLLFSLYNYSKINEFKRIVTEAFSPNGVVTFFEILLFGMGYILLSYFSLDGCIRVYMALISYFAFYLLRKLLFLRVYKTLNYLFDHLEFPLIFVLRVINLPFIWFYRKLSQIFVNFLGEFIKTKSRYTPTVLDKQNKKC